MVVLFLFNLQNINFVYNATLKFCFHLNYLIYSLLLYYSILM